MRSVTVSVLLVLATACSGADDPPKVTRKLDGDKTTFPAKTVADGVKTLTVAIESCHSSDWARSGQPKLADLDNAQKGDHVRFVFCTPIAVTVLGEKVEVSEAVFAAGAFLIRSGDKVMRCTKYEFDKMKPFQEWYRQTLPVD